MENPGENDSSTIFRSKHPYIVSKLPVCTETSDIFRSVKETKLIIFLNVAIKLQKPTQVCNINNPYSKNTIVQKHNLKCYTTKLKLKIYNFPEEGI